MTSPLMIGTIFGFPVSLFSAILAFLWIVYLWDNYLTYRQRRVAKKTTEVPNELQAIMKSDKFCKARLYLLDKNLFAIISGLYHIVELTVILYHEIIPWLWYKILQHSVVIGEFLRDRLGVSISVGAEAEIFCSLLFLLYTSVFMFFDSLPWSLYSTFVIEARYGFNNQTLGFFFKDRIKTLLVSLVIGFPVTAGLIWIIKAGGPHFYVLAYLFALVVTLFMMFIYPEFIAPLFDRYEPLPEGSLRDKIVALAASIGFPLKKLLVVEGSRRSAHSNAYFYGFGKNKRIVLYDTLIRGFKFPSTKVKKSSANQDKDPQVEEDSFAEGADNEDTSSKDAHARGCATDEEVVAVLAHELGHWKLGHTLINLFIGQANLLLMFVVFGMLMDIDGIFTSFGFVHGTPVLLRLSIIFQFIFSPYSTVLDFLMTVLSRRLEFQADAFAVDRGFANQLKTALITLQVDNLAFPVSDWLYSLCNFSHPPLLERLAAIDIKKAKMH